MWPVSDEGAGQRLRRPSVNTVTAALEHCFAFRDFIRSKLEMPKEVRGIVLDVGSGHSPHFRANVLVERYSAATGHRAGPAVTRDSNQFLLWADAERLPLKDKSVAYSVVSHVLEHVERPDAVCEELARVGLMGYIECPDAWIESIVPYPSHAWYVRLENGQLTFDAKKGESIARLSDDRSRHRRIKALFRDRSLWTVQLHWHGDIRYQVAGTPQASALSGDEGTARSRFATILVSVIGKTVGAFVRSIPLAEEELAEALCCPRCRGDLGLVSSGYACCSCDVIFPRSSRRIDFLSPLPKDSD